MLSQQSAPPARTTSTAVHTLRRVVASVLGVLLVTATAGALTVALYPTVTSGSAMAVLSGSMSPDYPVGAMVFTRAVEPADVVVGDVLTFQRLSDPAELVTHRVIAVDSSAGAPVFITKGDANNAADLDPVPASAVQGRLWFGVPELGRAAAILHSPQGLGFLILLICAVVAVFPGKRPEPTDVEPEGGEREGAPATRAVAPADLERTAAIALRDIRTVRLPPVPPPAPRPIRR